MENYIIIGILRYTCALIGQTAMCDYSTHTWMASLGLTCALIGPDWLQCFDKYYIKQIDSIFPCVCTLIDAQKTESIC